MLLMATSLRKPMCVMRCHLSWVTCRQLSSQRLTRTNMEADILLLSGNELSLWEGLCGAAFLVIAV